MANLNSVIEKIYASLSGGDTAVYREYEKIPAAGHEKIYAVAGISEIKLENLSYGRTGRRYSEKYCLRIRVLGSPDTPPEELYELLDGQIVKGLVSADFEVESVKISEPFQDNGLKRLVLECTAFINGRTEGIYESRS